MVLNIAPLTRFEQSAVSFVLQQPLSLDYKGNTAYFKEPASIEGEITILGEGLFQASGNIKAVCVTPCDCCLEEAEQALEITFSERYSRLEDQQDVYTFTGDTIDLSQMVEENVLLHMPMRILCKEDCRGLCPLCGTNLNYNQCNCVQQSVGAFDKLKSLMDEEEV